METRLPSLALSLRALRRSIGPAVKSAGPTRFLCTLQGTRSPLLNNAVVFGPARFQRHCQVDAARKVAAAAAKAEEKLNQTVDDSEWKTIFHYPYIKGLRMLCRFKVYQSVGTLLVCPPLFLAEFMGWMSPVASHALVALTLSASIVLLTTGYLSERVVGIMYVNKDCSQLRVAHMTFWGNRQDHVFQTSDVANFSDSGQAWGSWFIRLHRYSSPNDPLFVSLKHGGIVDRELFEKVFGQDLSKIK